MNENPYSAPEASVRDKNLNKGAVEMSLADIYFSFNGRINRQTYWLKFNLPVFTFFILVGVASAFMNFDIDSVVLVCQLLMIWPSLAVSVKRWHDRNKSGWYVCINFIPIIGPLWAFVENGFLAGTDGHNDYGYPQA